MEGALYLFFAACIVVGCSAVDNDCQEGWSSCDSSLWVTSDYNSGDPLSPYAPGDVRGPLEYEVKFSCRGRRNGYYADLDHSCKVWHYCNTTREVDQLNRIYSWTYMHYSYVCQEAGTRYDQVLRECVPESKAIVRCSQSELYYPKEEYVSDVPIVVSSNNRLVPVRCPTTQSEVKCQIQNDHIRLKGCPESPGLVVKFYSSLSDAAPSYFDAADASAGLTTVSPSRPGTYSSGRGDAGEDDLGDEEDDDSVHKKPDEKTPDVPASSSTEVPVDADDAGEDSAHESSGTGEVSPIAVSTATPVTEAQGTRVPITRPPISRGPLRPVHSVVRPKPFRFRDTPEVAARKTLAQNAPLSSNRKHLSPAAHVLSNARNDREDVNKIVFPVRVSHTPGPASEEIALSVSPVAPVHDKIDNSFDCTGRVYGYYADIANECKIYHVCAPRLNNGLQTYEHYSFICAEGLVFDQRRITCVPRDDISHECSQSESYYAARLSALPRLSSVASPVKGKSLSAVRPGRTVTVLTVRSTGKYAQASRGATKTSAPQAPKLASRYVQGKSQVKKFDSPRMQLRKSSNVTPRRKVVYRLKKGLRAPISYRQASPYSRKPLVSNERKMSQQLRAAPHSPSLRPQSLVYSPITSNDMRLNHSPGRQYIPPLVSPGRAVNGVAIRSPSSTVSLGTASVPTAKSSPLVSYPSPAYGGVARQFSRVEDEVSSLYW